MILYKEQVGSIHFLRKANLFSQMFCYLEIESSGIILQGWELKMPDTSIQDKDFIDNAAEKAKSLGLNSFLLWNAVDVRLYLLKNGEYTADTNFSIESSKYTTRRDVHDRPDIWKKQAASILVKLNVYLKTGLVKSVSPSIVFSDKGIVSIVLSCQADVKIYLEKTCLKSIKTDASVKSWWKCVAKEYPGYTTPFAPLSYCIIMRWFNRFVFSNILSAYGRINIKKGDISVNTTVMGNEPVGNSKAPQNYVPELSAAREPGEGKSNG